MAIHPDRNDAVPAEQVALVQQLFLRHSNSIRGYLLAATPDLGEVDDLPQNTFIAATRKAGQFTPGTNFLAWARAIVRIEILQRLRKLASQPQSLDPEVIDSLLAEAPDIDTDNRLIKALIYCLSLPSPRLRRALDLRYNEARKPAEIAESSPTWARSSP